MSDNGAVLAGYTIEYMAHYSGGTLYILVKPDEDLDGIVRAWCMDNQEFINIDGWLFTFELVAVDGN